MKLVQSVSYSGSGAVSNRLGQLLLVALLGLWLALAGSTVRAADAEEISRESHAALAKLYSDVPSAKLLGDRAKAILVFPHITKAGLVVGGQFGEGALIQGGKTVGYYNTLGASWGLQAGVQKYGYALMFMTDSAIEQLRNVKGFEVGVGPTVVVVDAGLAANASTSTLKDDIYAFIFDQKGLMAGLSVEGTKITKLDK